MKTTHAKKIGSLLLLLLLTLTAKAQVRYGLRTGIGYSSFIYKMEGQYQSGARFGYGSAFVLDIPLKNKLSLRPELIYHNQGGNFYTQKYATEAYLKPDLVKSHFHSLQLPINLAYNIPLSDIQLTLMAGPAIDYSFAGNISYDGSDRSVSFGTEESNDYKPFDLAVNIGFAAEYKHLFFQISSAFGVLDRKSTPYKEESAVLQNNVSFSLGYFFH